MTLFVAVANDEKAGDAFEVELNRRALEYTRHAPLRRHFTLEADAEAVEWAASCGLLGILEESSAMAGPDETQSVVIEEDGFSGAGSWQSCRVIRRRNPTRWPNNSFPISTKFEATRLGGGCDLYCIDTGVEHTLAEFGGRVTQPFVATGVPSSPLDSQGHGTKIMSVALGVTVGLAREALGFSFKFSDGSDGGTDARAIEAMAAVLSHYNSRSGLGRPAALFWSWAGMTSAVSSAVSDLIDAGLPVTFSAGNTLEDLDTLDKYPTESDPDGIICGGSDIKDFAYRTGNQLGTNWGAPVDIVAPSQWVKAQQRTLDGGTFSPRNGTSYASPLVAAAIVCAATSRTSDRAGVQATKAALLSRATQGALRPTYYEPIEYDVSPSVLIDLPDRLLYSPPN